MPLNPPSLHGCLSIWHFRPRNFLYPALSNTPIDKQPTDLGFNRGRRARALIHRYMVYWVLLCSKGFTTSAPQYFCSNWTRCIHLDKMAQLELALYPFTDPCIFFRITAWFTHSRFLDDFRFSAQQENKFQKNNLSMLPGVNNAWWVCKIPLLC